MKNKIGKTLLLLLIFGVAMGLLESAVVVYLRTLYYPMGFGFPLSIIPLSIYKVEILREIATLIMLVCIAWLSGKFLTELFAWFLYSFAIWDLSYYAFLYIFIQWPSSLLTWDLLFLIPTLWVAPVLAPVLVSFTFIMIALSILTYRKIKPLSSLSWFLLISGFIILFISFIEDYISFLTQKFSLKDIFNSSLYPDLVNFSTQYVPLKYNWILFLIGEILLFFSIFVYRRRG